MTGPAMALPVAPPWALGQGGGPVAVPPTMMGAGGLPVASASIQIPLPEVLPIPDAHEFNTLGFIASAGIQTNVVIPGTIVDVPANNYGVVRGVTLYITNMLVTTDVIWSLQIDQASPQGYNQITIFPRAAPFVSNGFDSMVRFQGPARLQVIFSNRDGGAYVIGAAISGWFWPEASDARWRRFGM
jgi:hypothetical protein